MSFSLSISQSVSQSVGEHVCVSLLVCLCLSLSNEDTQLSVETTVWRTTPSLVCYAESVYLPLIELIKQKHKYILKMSSNRVNGVDDPLMFVIDIVK